MRAWIFRLFVADSLSYSWSIKTGADILMLINKFFGLIYSLLSVLSDFDTRQWSFVNLIDSDSATHLDDPNAPLEENQDSDLAWQNGGLKCFIVATLYRAT